MVILSYLLTPLNYTNYMQSREKELYGVKIEPLELSPILGNRIKLSQSLLGYQVSRLVHYVKIIFSPILSISTCILFNLLWKRMLMVNKALRLLMLIFLFPGIKPPTLGIFSPPEITCDTPSGYPIFVLQEVHRSLWIRCACCQCLMYL